MTIRRRCNLLLITALVAASGVLPALASELQVSPPHKAVSAVSLKKKPAHPRNIEIVGVEPLTRSESALERYFPIILGVAY